MFQSFTDFRKARHATTWGADAFQASTARPHQGPCGACQHALVQRSGQVGAAALNCGRPGETCNAYVVHNSGLRQDRPFMPAERSVPDAKMQSACSRNRLHAATPQRPKRRVPHRLAMALGCVLKSLAPKAWTTAAPPADRVKECSGPYCA